MALKQLYSGVEPKISIPICRLAHILGVIISQIDWSIITKDRRNILLCYERLSNMC